MASKKALGINAPVTGMWLAACGAGESIHVREKIMAAAERLGLDPQNHEPYLYHHTNPSSFTKSDRGIMEWAESVELPHVLPVGMKRRKDEATATPEQVAAGVVHVLTQEELDAGAIADSPREVECRLEHVAELGRFAATIAKKFG